MQIFLLFFVSELFFDSLGGKKRKFLLPRLAGVRRKLPRKITEEADLVCVAAAPLAGGEMPLKTLPENPRKRRVLAAREDAADLRASRTGGELEEGAEFLERVHGAANQFFSRHSRKAMRAR